MKKKYLLIVFAVLFGTVITGCQAPADRQSAQPSSQGSSESVQTTDSSLDEADSQGTSSADNGSDLTASDADNSAAQELSGEEHTMKEQQLLEYNGLTLSAVAWDAESASLQVAAQNESDQDYIIQFFNTSVNNYMMEPVFSMNINASSEANEHADFLTSNFNDCGIQDVSQIQTRITVLDAISFGTVYTSDYVTIQTGIPDPGTPPDESGDVIYNQDGLKLISRGFSEDPIWGKLWKVYIANDSEQDLILHTPKAVLNGCTLDVIFSASVPSGKKAVSSMTIFQEDLDANQITDITSAQISLKLQDDETYETIRTIDNLSLIP